MAPITGVSPLQLLSAVRRTVAATVHKLRPDHRTITERAVVFPATGMERFYLAVAVAPSRAAARRFDDRQAVRARAFITDTFPDLFAERPVTTDRDVTAFALNARDGTPERALYIHRSGLVELLWALTPHTDAAHADGAIDLDAAEIAAVVARLARGIAGHPYTEISRAGRGRRRLAKLDWWINLTAYVDQDDGQLAWSGLRFPGPEPPRASREAPAASPDGFGEHRVCNRRRLTASDHVALELLEELLAANGYYDYTAAAADAARAGVALPALPAPAPLPTIGGRAPTEDQVRVLDAIYAHFRADGRRVGFRTLDKELDLEGLELRGLANTMPPGLLLPVVASRGGFYRDDDELMVTAGGLRHCAGGQDALTLLTRAMAYLARRERPFLPADDSALLWVTCTDLAHALSLTTLQLEQLHLLLGEYERRAWTQVQTDPAGFWSIAIAGEYVRRFRGITTAAEYLRACDGESFAARSDAPQTTPHFVLSGDATEPDLEGERPISLWIENHGPSEVLEATVITIENADAPTPWHVRWRDTSDTAKEILAGGHWMLDIVRCDGLHGANENAWTPGFAFLKPDGSEAFVATTGGGGPNDHYGVPMDVRVRVTPRSDPERALEIALVLQITMGGLTATWHEPRLGDGRAS